MPRDQEPWDFVRTDFVLISLISLEIWEGKTGLTTTDLLSLMLENWCIAGSDEVFSDEDACN